MQTSEGRYAVKLGYPTPVHEWTAAAPAREAAILRQLAQKDNIYSGEWSEGTWSAQPWHDGSSLFELWRPGRHHSYPREPSRGQALACATALADLHAAGWAHGDVQPNHFLIRPDGASLIDLALAHGGEVPEAYDFPYRGCLVHYEAPEISHSILAEGMAVPTMAADVYGLGASWFLSATGWRHVSYPDDADRKDQRRAIVDKPHRPINVPGPLGEVIEEMMRRTSADRPTAAEVCAAIRDML
ncbi:protein kinase domain-containing protein [Streptomyces rhizoryzae]|uniref:protein kinase domain-containing protein n=1 Tax=Streptomyces rhizoryzae TaxID=2932493 RepID=UPI0027E46423|nr:lipopolysaccharide kinase InaA family protein [Streptomyces rhizoryzae]